MGAGLQTGKTVATIAPSKHAYTKDYLVLPVCKPDPLVYLWWKHAC
jgi:hypothetical protein